MWDVFAQLINTVTMIKSVQLKPCFKRHGKFKHQLSNHVLSVYEFLNFNSSSSSYKAEFAIDRKADLDALSYIFYHIIILSTGFLYSLCPGFTSKAVYQASMFTGAPMVL